MVRRSQCALAAKEEKNLFLLLLPFAFRITVATRDHHHQGAGLRRHFLVECRLQCGFQKEKAHSSPITHKRGPFSTVTDSAFVEEEAVMKYLPLRWREMNKIALSSCYEFIVAICNMQFFFRVWLLKTFQTWQISSFVSDIHGKRPASASSPQCNIFCHQSSYVRWWTD